MTKPNFVYVTYIRTSPEKLWQALTDGASTRQYWAGRRVESDWTVGAPVTFWFDGKVSDSGKVLECDPPRRLSYSFHVEFVEALRSELGENLFSKTDASGQAALGPPGQNGLGIIRQNSLEASNVEPVKELIDLITTQRGFELNSQAIQAGDQLLQQIANLRRG